MGKKIDPIKATELIGMKYEQFLEPGLYMRISYGLMAKNTPIIHYAKIPNEFTGELAITLIDKIEFMIDSEREERFGRWNGNFHKFYKKFKNLFKEKSFNNPKNKLRKIINDNQANVGMNYVTLVEVMKLLTYLFLDIEYHVAMPQYVKIIKIDESGNEYSLYPQSGIPVHYKFVEKLITPTFEMLVALFHSTLEIDAPRTGKKV